MYRAKAIEWYEKVVLVELRKGWLRSEASAPRNATGAFAKRGALGSGRAGSILEQQLRLPDTQIQALMIVVCADISARPYQGRGSGARDDPREPARDGLAGSHRHRAHAVNHVRACALVRDRRHKFYVAAATSARTGARCGCGGEG